MKNLLKPTYLKKSNWEGLGAIGQMVTLGIHIGIGVGVYLILKKK